MPYKTENRCNVEAFKHCNDMTSLPVAQEISKFLGEASLTKQTLNLSKIFDNQFIKADTDLKEAN